MAGAMASGDTFFPPFAIFAICTTSIWIFVDFETRTITSFDVCAQLVCARPSISNSTITNDSNEKWWKRKMRLELTRVHWQSQNWWKSFLIENSSLICVSDGARGQLEYAKITSGRKRQQKWKMICVKRHQVDANSQRISTDERLALAQSFRFCLFSTIA